MMGSSRESANDYIHGNGIEKSIEVDILEPFCEDKIPVSYCVVSYVYNYRDGKNM